MIDIIRHKDYFNPLEIKDNVHIIGCGAVGSNIALYLARLGVEKFILWDYDEVESHNVANQAFLHEHIDMLKTEALTDLIHKVNPHVEVIQKGKYKEQSIEGFIFLAPDSIEVRSEFYEAQQFNENIKAIIDGRIELEKGQVLSAKWSKESDQEFVRDMSDFTSDEVETPVSACGTKLAVLPTITMVANIAVTNFIKFYKEEEMKLFVQFNMFNFKISR